MFIRSGPGAFHCLKICFVHFVSGLNKNKLESLFSKKSHGDYFSELKAVLLQDLSLQHQEVVTQLETCVAATIDWFKSSRTVVTPASRKPVSKPAISLKRQASQLPVGGNYGARATGGPPRIAARRITLPPSPVRDVSPVSSLSSRSDSPPLTRDVIVTPKQESGHPNQRQESADDACRDLEAQLSGSDDLHG